MKIEFFTIDELNYLKEHCDFTEDELYLLDEKSKGKTLEETGFDIDTLNSVKSKIKKALEDREIKTMTVAEIKEKINKAIENSAGERKTTAVRYLLSVLHSIKSMLDQLDEWVSVDDGLPSEDEKAERKFLSDNILMKDDENNLWFGHYDFVQKRFCSEQFNFSPLSIIKWKYAEPYKESEENE